VVIIILSVLFYLVFVFLSGADEVMDALFNVKVVYIPFILLIVFTSYVLRGIRWNYYLKKINLDFDKKEGFLLYFSGLSMLITPMMLSGVIKVGLIKAKRGTSISSTFPIVIIERLTDLVGILVLVFAGLFFFNADPYFISVTLFVIVFLLIVIIIVQNKTLCLAILSKMGKNRIIKKITRMLEEAYSTMYILLSPRNVAVASVIAFFSWSLEAIALYLIFLGMGIHLNILQTMFIYAFPLVLGIISQLPGGIGAEEGSMLGLMMMSDVPAGTSAAAILLFRMLTLWFGLIMGVITLRFYTTRYLSDDAKKDINKS
jgi:uncharacterized protein (TIRG00374 family)